MKTLKEYVVEIDNLRTDIEQLKNDLAILKNEKFEHLSKFDFENDRRFTVKILYHALCEKEILLSNMLKLNLSEV